MYLHIYLNPGLKKLNKPNIMQIVSVQKKSYED